MENFTPIEAGKIRLYVCGMTVYDHAHIGHARAMVVFDAFVRYLRHRAWDVRFIRNFTDVDDKIIQVVGAVRAWKSRHILRLEMGSRKAVHCPERVWQYQYVII